MSAELDDGECSAMDLAVRLAVRGHGRVEPNPMVGCVVLARDQTLAGWGLHRRIGGDHAEVEALRRAGEAARGGTLVVTLEPCAHHGRTPPCVDAIERAGIARVVYATADPNAVAAGGAARLRERGIAVVRVDHAGADALNAPFVKRVTTGLPWVCAKWAQTIDGAIAASSGASRWISSERLRRMVHRERGRVDAILTGIGTVKADDPMLTPRHGTVRRMPMRVVVDPEGALDSRSALVRSASAEAPVIDAVLAGARVAKQTGDEGGRRTHDRPGVVVMPYDGSLRSLLAALAASQGASRVMVEAGGGLLGQLEREALVDEWWVVMAPMLAGDARAPRAIRGFEPSDPSAMMRRSLVGLWRRGDEVVLLYRRASAATVE